MANITNTDVFGLASSIFRSGYPMMDKAPTETEFRNNVANIEECIAKNDNTNPHSKWAVKLGNAKGGGHDQYLTGIIVNFDLTLSNKAWVEAERYTFLNFISSMSSMHRASIFKIGDCCNKYVSKEEIKEAERCLKNIYAQRRNHRLPDWHIVCDWIEKLPYFKELCLEGLKNV